MDSKRGDRMSEETSMEQMGNGEGNGKVTNGHDKMPSNAITQWKSILRATKVINQFKAKEDREKPEVDDPVSQVDPTSQVDDPASQADPASQVDEKDSKVNDGASEDDPASQLEYLKVLHQALVDQFNAFGIILTLLVAVTSVAILQPPGSFQDQGHMSSSKLVACFLMFSSISFLLACTGLMAVIVGSASLLRPWFFKKFSSQSEAIALYTRARLEETKTEGVVYDDISTLTVIILDNLFQVRRLRIYLAFSLGSCMVAFVCGASAILGTENRNKYMAIGTIVISGVVLVLETLMTLVGPTQSPKWIRRCIRLVKKGVGSEGSDSEFSKSISKNLRMTLPRIKQGFRTKQELIV